MTSARPVDSYMRHIYVDLVLTLTGKCPTILWLLAQQKVVLHSAGCAFMSRPHL